MMRNDIQNIVNAPPISFLISIHKPGHFTKEQFKNTFKKTHKLTQKHSLVPFIV